MIVFVIFTCHMFSSYSFWANLLFYCDFFLFFYYLKPGFVPCPEDKLMVHDLTTGVCEYCWWFLLSAILFRPSCVKTWCECSLPIVSHFAQAFMYMYNVLRFGVYVVGQFQPFCSSFHVIRFGVIFFLQKTGTQIFSYSFIECNVEHLIQIQ